jgi:hypothetical protein
MFIIRFQTGFTLLEIFRFATDNINLRFGDIFQKRDMRPTPAMTSFSANFHFSFFQVNFGAQIFQIVFVAHS